MNWRIAWVWLTLLLAAAGPLPLCLHHEISHAGDHVALEELTSCGHCHHHSHACSSQFVQQDPVCAWDSDHEDCRLCYELAQVGLSHGAAHEDAMLASAHVRRVLSESALLASRHTSWSLRGPPSVQT
ncbi:MAG: hypothetical protein U0905_10795 [Pirellulales bacterium]